MRIPYDEVHAVLFQLFLRNRFPEEKAQLLARTHAESSLAGVSSHGINRVPVFIQYVEEGWINVDMEAEKVGSFDSLERWDGRFGSGVVNATLCTNRAIELAQSHGMGMVALRNTNHWMRAGTYGSQAAEAGCIAILFTNTQPNMPPWGGKDSRLGNNPLVVAIPRKEGNIVLDMALSQFSFGKIHSYKLQGKKLPFLGGWDENDKLSDDPEKILQKERGLPIGYWKGSGLSMVLDMLATLLSAGNSTYRVGLKERETGISQVFLCINPEVFEDQALQQTLIEEIITYAHDVAPMQPGGRTFYPGEQSAQTRIQNLKDGIPVDETVWGEILALLG